MAHRFHTAIASCLILVCATAGACASGDERGAAGAGSDAAPADFSSGDDGGAAGIGSGAAPREFSECCARDADCASGVCSTDQRVCTVRCTVSEDCPAEPKSGEPDCKTSIGMCQAERAGVDCEGDAAGTGGASGSGAGNSGEGGSGARGASTGGSSGAGGTTSLPNIVNCAAVSAKDPWNGTQESLVCTCEGDGNAGETSYRGDACGQSDTDLFCCASTGADSCSCYQERSWQCNELVWGNENDFCDCYYYGSITNWASRSPTASCSVETKTYATQCYVWTTELGAERCQCDSRPLPAGARVVSSCTTAEEAGIDTILLECPPDTTSVSTCSDGLYEPPSGGGCGSDCSGIQCVGDSLCCVYSCQGDSCVQSCNF